MKLFSYVGSVVLDPFLGCSTTLLACALNGRVGIGVDIDPEYCDLAQARVLESIAPQE